MNEIEKRNEIQEKFYRSKEWLATRKYIMEKNNYICQRCKGTAKIVHHIIYLNESNIHDPIITLGEDNLMAVCQECHNQIHYSKGMIEDGLIFTDNGDIVMA